METLSEKDLSKLQKNRLKASGRSVWSTTVTLMSHLPVHGCHRFDSLPGWFIVSWFSFFPSLASTMLSLREHSIGSTLWLRLLTFLSHANQSLQYSKFNFSYLLFFRFVWSQRFWGRRWSPIAVISFATCSCTSLKMSATCRAVTLGLHAGRRTSCVLFHPTVRRHLILTPSLPAA